MINYFTRRIKISEIKIDDYIDINGQICKILSIYNNDNMYNIEVIDEIDNIYKYLYDNKKKFIKYIFIYTYEIWRIQDFTGDGIEYVKKEKIKDNFITYKNAELYAHKYINLILDKDIAEYLDEIFIIKSTDYITFEKGYDISNLIYKLS
jgi:hypothetical protein